MHPSSPPGGRLSSRVQEIPASGIRRYFDLMAEMDGVISLGVGEPDFTTPPPPQHPNIYCDKHRH